MTEIPRIPAEITAISREELLRVARSAFGEAGETFDSCQWTRLSQREDGGVFRVTGMRGENHTVWSMILKATWDETTRDEPEVAGPRRESLAYASGLFADLPDGLRAPRHYGIEESEPGMARLWLEDVADPVSGSWPCPSSNERRGISAGSMAGI